MAVINLWNECARRNPSSNHITINTFFAACKKSNEEKYWEIHHKYVERNDDDLKRLMMDSKHKFDYHKFIQKYDGKTLTRFDKIINDLISVFGKKTVDGGYIFKAGCGPEDYDEGKKLYFISKSCTDLTKYRVWAAPELAKKVTFKKYKDDVELVPVKISEIYNASRKSRFIYRDIVFEPKGCSVEYYNTWSGFRAEEVDEPVDMDAVAPFLRHMKEAIAGGDHDVFRYHLKWLAHMIQKPWEKPEIALVIIGKEGCGKGRFMEIIRKLIGRRLAVEVNNMDAVSNRFNDILMGRLLVCFNEASNVSGNYRSAFDKMKSLITDYEQFIEKKGIDKIRIRDYNRFIFTTNNYRPVSISPNDRRYCINVASDTFVRDRKYFKNLSEHIEDEYNINHFFTYLKQHTSTIDLRNDIPLTSIRKSLMKVSLTRIVDILAYIVNEFPDNRKYLTVDEFMSFCEDEFGKNYKSKRHLGHDMKKYFPMDAKGNLPSVRIDGKKTRVYKIDKKWIAKCAKTIDGVDITNLNA
jgi:hypothetical protein